MDFFPVLFAVPRVVGWLAHWRQMMLQEGGVKIWRPRQVRGCRSCHAVSLIHQSVVKVYVGAGKRDYVPVEKREAVEGLRQTPSAVEHGG